MSRIERLNGNQATGNSPHLGSALSIMKRRQKRCKAIALRGPAAIRRFSPSLLEKIADFTNLRCAWAFLQQKGGEAPGPDGQTYSDYSQRERYAVLRALSQAILNGTYISGGERIVTIPKPRGRGFRRLRLANIVDRVVARGVLQLLEPLLDPGFSRLSFGFRPGRNRQQALAQAEMLARRDGRWNWVCDDIENAFDNVPLQRLFQIVRRNLPHEPLVDLLERVVFGADPRRTRGLGQGSPLSPLLLNLYCHHFLDQRWQRSHPTIPLLRYADDLLLLCESREEAVAAYNDLRRMVQDAGLALKGCQAEAIHLVEGNSTAEWLGMQIRRTNDSVRFDVTEEVWEDLADGLAEAQSKINSPLLANAIVNGLVSQLGMVYRDAAGPQAVFCRVLRDVATDAGFDEIPSPAELLDDWRQAAESWRKTRARYECLTLRSPGTQTTSSA